jgi:cytochrome c-type biogenesis protein CcsB
MIYEGIILWAAIGFYMMAFFVYLYAIVFRRDRTLSWGWRFIVTAFIFHVATMIVRWVITGHPPVLWTYEHALLSSWCVSLIFIITGTLRSSVRLIGIIVAPVVMLIIGYGLMSHGTAHEPLPPPYKSNWLWVHVAFAWFAYSAFALSAFAASVYLLKERAERVGGWTFLKRVPSLNILDDIIFRIIFFGFVGLSIEMGAGAIWAFGLWGRYWAWDPMETWTLISWLTYALYMHLWVTMKWRGSRMAWLSIAAFITILIAFGGIAMMFGLHATLI